MMFWIGGSASPSRSFRVLLHIRCRFSTADLCTENLQCNTVTNPYSQLDVQTSDFNTLIFLCCRFLPKTGFHTRQFLENPPLEQLHSKVVYSLSLHSTYFTVRPEVEMLLCFLLCSLHIFTYIAGCSVRWLGLHPLYSPSLLGLCISGDREGG